MTAHGSILYLDSVSVSFDGFKALNNLSLILQPGEMRAIIGPNGAGKTTMMDVITGKTRPDTGDVIFDSNHDLIQMDEAAIAQLGIGRKFQKPYRCRARLTPLFAFTYCHDEILPIKLDDATTPLNNSSEAFAADSRSVSLVKIIASCRNTSMSCFIVRTKSPAVTSSDSSMSSNEFPFAQS